MTIRHFGTAPEVGGKATGRFSHAEGYGTNATELASHAEGWNALASGLQSHAEGWASAATGNYSHAGGYAGKADAINSWASGWPAAAVSGSRAQVSIYKVGCLTTSGSSAAATLTMDGQPTVNVSGGAAQNVLTLAPYTAYLFDLKVVARRPAGVTGSQGWIYSGLATRDSGGAVLAGTVTQIATWSNATQGTVTITIDPTPYLKISFAPSNTTQVSVFGVLTVAELALTS